MPHSQGTEFSLITLLSIAWGAYLVVLVGWIALQKRSPVSTLSWILSLAALPYLGLVIYYFFGPQRLKRTRLKRVGRRKFSGRRQRQIASLARYAENIGSARQLATLIRRSSGAMPTTATTFELLNTGSKTFDALLAAIDAAVDHIHLEYYIFEPDRVGRLFREHLIERARAGVKVRLLLDSLGSKGINRRFIAPMLEAGCEVLFFHPVRLRQLRPVINMRTHRKIVICDGRVGFTGGVNITEEEDERLRPDAYHDLHLRLEGPVVHALQRVFLED